MTQRIEISYKTILFVFATIGVLWFLNQVKDLLLSLFVAFVLMSALKPAVDKLEKLKIPRVLAIAIIYLLIILFLITIGAAIIPVMIQETIRLFKFLPSYFENASKLYNFDLKLYPMELVPAAGGGVLKFTFGIFSNILSLVSLFVFTFYLLLERNHLKETLENLFGKEIGGRVSLTLSKVEKRLGGWLQAQFILCLVVGLGTFIGLSLLKVEYALALALLAGVLEILPTIGPIISAIPAVIITLVTSPFLALATAALYFIVQQTENNLIVPNVMKKTTGLSPLVVILSLMIGGRLMGILGIILAVPTILVIQVLVQEFLVGKK